MSAEIHAIAEVVAELRARIEAQERRIEAQAERIARVEGRGESAGRRWISQREAMRICRCGRAAIIAAAESHRVPRRMIPGRGRHRITIHYYLPALERALEIA